MRRLLPSFLLKQIKSISNSFLHFILRPLSPHVRKCRRFLSSVFILLILLGVCYSLCLILGSIDIWNALFFKFSLALGNRALSLFLLEIGFSSGLAFALGFAVKALLTAEDLTFLTHFMSPEREGTSGAASSESWTRILLGSASESEYSTSTEGSSSVNKADAPPANAVASPGEGAGPSRPFERYPYEADEVIGGDSVLSIARRLKEKNSNPSAEDIYLAHIQAKDRFEVKVDIIRQMTSLDPEGDWFRRGARALENPRTATGEESLERLFSLRDELNSQGKESQAFAQSKVLRKWDDDDRSSAS